MTIDSAGGTAVPPGRRAISYVDTLPVLRPKIRAAGFSMMGVRRTRNQDAFAIDPSNRYFVVADGMGGHLAGEKASRLAIDTLSEHAEQTLRLSSELAQIAAVRRAFTVTNQRIVDEATRSSDVAGMGTTAVLALLNRDRLHLASAGDSRAYLVRKGRVRQLTVDQTVAQVMVDAGVYDGVPWREVPNRNMLWNCLGRSEFYGVDPRVTLIHPHDRIVLTTDGVSDYLETDALAEIVTQQTRPRDAAEELVVLAQQNGSHDDSTCVVVYCDPIEREDHPIQDDTLGCDAN